MFQPYRVGSRKEEGVAPLKLSARSIYNQSAVNFSFFIDILSTNYCYLPTYLHLYLYRISYAYYIIYSIYLANAMFIVSLFSLLTFLEMEYISKSLGPSSSHNAVIIAWVCIYKYLTNGYKISKKFLKTIVTHLFKMCYLQALDGKEDNIGRG